MASQTRSPTSWSTVDAGNQVDWSNPSNAGTEPGGKALTRRRMGGVTFAHGGPQPGSGMMMW